MGSLSSICGCVTIPNEDTIPFGGFFVNNWYRKDDNFFVGSLTDNHGLSEITGIYLEGIKTTFEKCYLGRKDKIEYSFEFDKTKNLWIGNYQTDKGEKGEAICEISPILEGVEFGESYLGNTLKINYKQILPNIY